MTFILSLFIGILWLLEGIPLSTGPTFKLYTFWCVIFISIAVPILNAQSGSHKSKLATSFALGIFVGVNLMASFVSVVIFYIQAKFYGILFPLLKFCFIFLLLKFQAKYKLPIEKQP